MSGCVWGWGAGVRANKATEIAVTCHAGCRMFQESRGEEPHVNEQFIRRTYHSYRILLHPDRESWRKRNTEERTVDGGPFTGYFLSVLLCTWNKCKTIQGILMKLGIRRAFPFEVQFKWYLVLGEWFPKRGAHPSRAATLVTGRGQTLWGSYRVKFNWF